VISPKVEQQEHRFERRPELKAKDLVLRQAKPLFAKADAVQY
jgi:hypothetical protein